MKICFLYGGQGSQKKGMGKDLYDQYSIFKDFYDSLSTDFDLKDYSFNQSDEEISKTQYTQPLMVAFQIGITKILKEKGVTPDIVGGLSIGEYSARRELKISIFFTLYRLPSSLIRGAFFAAIRPSFANVLLGRVSNTSLNSASAAA